MPCTLAFTLAKYTTCALTHADLSSTHVRLAGPNLISVGTVGLPLMRHTETIPSG